MCESGEVLQCVRTVRTTLRFTVYCTIRTEIASLRLKVQPAIAPGELVARPSNTPSQPSPFVTPILHVAIFPISCRGTTLDRNPNVLIGPAPEECTKSQCSHWTSSSHTFEMKDHSILQAYGGASIPFTASAIWDNSFRAHWALQVWLRGFRTGGWGNLGFGLQSQVFKVEL